MEAPMNHNAQRKMSLKGAELCFPTNTRWHYSGLSVLQHPAFVQTMDLQSSSSYLVFLLITYF